MNYDYILLKWGSLKGWHMQNNDVAFELLKEYHMRGVYMSAALQRDSAEQKHLLCKMIDAFDGRIENDWDGTIYQSKEDAKSYILNYGKDQ